MNRYDPSQTPEIEAWLELDEQERILLVERYHRHARIKLPKLKMHAVIYVIVENQLALGEDPVVRALARLMQEGLSRHDAVHAIGSVLAEHMYSVMRAEASAIPSAAEYLAAVEQLTAAKWRDG